MFSFLFLQDVRKNLEQKPSKEKELKKALEIRDKILITEETWAQRQHKINAEIEGSRQKDWARRSPLE